MTGSQGRIRFRAWTPAVLVRNFDVHVQTVDVLVRHDGPGAVPELVVTPFIGDLRRRGLHFRCRTDAGGPCPGFQRRLRQLAAESDQGCKGFRGCLARRRGGFQLAGQQLGLDILCGNIVGIGEERTDLVADEPRQPGGRVKQQVLLFDAERSHGCSSRLAFNRAYPRGSRTPCPRRSSPRVRVCRTALMAYHDTPRQLPDIDHVECL